jgi:hypothetical protein
LKIGRVGSNQKIALCGTRVSGVFPATEAATLVCAHRIRTALKTGRVGSKIIVEDEKNRSSQRGVRDITKLCCGCGQHQTHGCSDVGRGKMLANQLCQNAYGSHEQSSVGSLIDVERRAGGTAISETSYRWRHYIRRRISHRSRLLALTPSWPEDGRYQVRRQRYLGACLWLVRGKGRAPSLPCSVCSPDALCSSSSLRWRLACS